MNRNKGLSFSQEDLVTSTDPTEYKVSSNSYSLQDLSSSAHKLPLVIRVDDGFYGKTDWTTVSSNEIIYLHRLELRKRALATAEDGTRYSFPLDYPLLFIMIQLNNPTSVTKTSRSGKKNFDMAMHNEVPVESRPMSLKDIIADYKLPISVVIDDAYVIFHSSNHDRDPVQFGKLTLTHVYDEKYFVGNEVRNGNLSQQVILLPTFLRVKVRLVQGFAQKNKKRSWKIAVTEWTSRASKINYDAVSPPSDVAEFKPDAVAKFAKSPAKLDTIEPNTYIKLMFLPIDKDHTYEELPVVSDIHSIEPGVSTFTMATKSVSNPAIHITKLPKSDTDVYTEVESPTTESPPPFITITSNLESVYQQQKFSVPGKRLEPRSYSPVPLPPTTVNTVTAPVYLPQKPSNRAPMPLPKKTSSDTETRHKSDVPFIVNPSQSQYDGFVAMTQATHDRYQMYSLRDKESSGAIRDQQRRVHPVVPLPPALSDLQKVLKPAPKPVDLEPKSTFLDKETSKSENRTLPQKSKPHKPRSKTDVSLSTSELTFLQRETPRPPPQDIKASELDCEEPGDKPPLLKYKTPHTKLNKVPFPKTPVSLPANDHGIADPTDDTNTTSLDCDDLLCTGSNIKVPHKIKLPLPLPCTESKSSLPDTELFRAESPKAPPHTPKPPPPVYNFPSTDFQSSLSGNEQTAPETPQLNYEKLSGTGGTDSIEVASDIPEQLDNLSCHQLADCLKLLNMESYIKTFVANQIDGKLFLELDEQILISDLQVTKLHAKKLLMFAHRGWRP